MKTTDFDLERAIAGDSMVAEFAGKSWPVTEFHWFETDDSSYSGTAIIYGAKHGVNNAGEGLTTGMRLRMAPKIERVPFDAATWTPDQKVVRVRNGEVLKGRMPLVDKKGSSYPVLFMADHGNSEGAAWFTEDGRWTIGGEVELFVEREI